MVNFNRNDTINLFSKLSFRRAWNLTKVVSSFYLSKWTKRPIQWGVPDSISFEPTTSCNLRCPECPSGLRSFTRPKGMLEMNFFRNMIDQLAPELIYLTFYFQGEPYLNPDFLDMVKYASSKKIYTATSTNAHYLDDENARRTVESGLDRLIISLDGTTQEVYSQYRVGGDLDKVLRGAANIVKWKKRLNSKTPYVFFQFLVVRPNEHQLREARELSLKTGVDGIRYKTAQIYDFASDPNQLIPQHSLLTRYKKTKDGSYISKNPMQNHCWRLWHAPVITWDGLVVPCCFDKDARHRMGDLKNKSFKEIWKQPEYLDFRRKILKGRSEIDICSNCSEGVKVWGD
jgi:radical SAM protein with 4Fe4S-binding SPASM domain